MLKSKIKTREYVGMRKFRLVQRKQYLSCSCSSGINNERLLSLQHIKRCNILNVADLFSLLGDHLLSILLCIIHDVFYSKEHSELHKIQFF